MVPFKFSIKWISACSQLIVIPRIIFTLLKMSINNSHKKRYVHDNIYQQLFPFVFTSIWLLLETYNKKIYIYYLYLLINKNGTMKKNKQLIHTITQMNLKCLFKGKKSEKHLHIIRVFVSDILEEDDWQFNGCYR